jgi:DNA-binding NarL/FixJ family response regulator
MPKIDPGCTGAAGTAESELVPASGLPAAPGVLQPDEMCLVRLRDRFSVARRCRTRRWLERLSPMSKLGVVVVDDHALFAEALGQRLAVEPDIEVLAGAYDARSAMASVATLRPDLVTLDIRLGEEDGVALCGRLVGRLPGLPVVAVTGVEDPVRAVAGIRAGVRAWVLKDDVMPVLLGVIRGAAAGESYFPPALLGRMLPLLATEVRGPVTDHRLARLTERELEVLQCMVDGYDRRAIAAALFVSVNTVRTHTQSVLSKLHVHSSLEAVAVALSAGLRSRTASDTTS